MARKPKPPKLTWDQEQQIRLRDALRPATLGPLTRDEAYKLIYVSAQSLRQGLSLHGRGIEDVLDGLFRAARSLMTKVTEAELDAIIAGLTENQRWTIRGEHEKSGVYHLGHAFLPNKWMTLHSNAVIDGIIKKGLTRKRTEEEISHGLFVEKRGSVGHECLNELGVQVAERMAALTAEIGYVPDKAYFVAKGIKAK